VTSAIREELWETVFSVGCVPKLHNEDQRDKPVYSLEESPESVAGRPICRRSSQIVAPREGLRGRGAHIVVNRCVATPSCDTDASQRGQKPLDTESEEATVLEAVARQPLKIEQTEKI
jgi:hypothetical protein